MLVCPDGHGMHGVLPPGEYVPGWQALQGWPPPTVPDPGGQSADHSTAQHGTAQNTATPDRMQSLQQSVTTITEEWVQSWFVYSTPTAL